MKKQVLIADLIPLIKESLDKDKHVIFVPSGSSMLPTLIGGKDEVTLARPDYLKPLDIVLYEREDGIYVLHRLIGIKNGEYLMFGDNQVYVERGIKRDQIIAKVIKFTHKGKKVDCSDRAYRFKSNLRVKTRAVRKIFTKIKGK